jgi:hypothetical protein
LAFGFDRARNGLCFQFLLEDGQSCEVLFPIGHVACVFEQEAAALGYVGMPMMGHIETVDGFLGYVETMPELGWFGSKLVKSIGKAATSVGKFAYNNTVKKVANQAVAVARVATNIASGKNVVKSVGGLIKSNQGDLKIVAQYAGTVPGIGTAVGALASGANAALSGKSLTEIAKATAVGAIPGGPLAQAAVSAAVNLAQRGIEGQNLVKAASSELVNAAISMAPAATQNTIRQTVQAALAGRNVVTAAGRAVLQTAIAQVPDASARALLQHVASGNVTPESIVHAAGAQLTAKLVGSAPSGAVSKMLNTAAAIAPATPHFQAISAQGLAAAVAGHTVARAALAAPTRANVATLQKAKQGWLNMQSNNSPAIALVAAALKSANTKAA